MKKRSAVTHTTYAAVKFKSENNSVPNGIQTHDLCDTTTNTRSFIDSIVLEELLECLFIAAK